MTVDINRRFEALFEKFNDRGKLIERQNKINSKLDAQNKKLRDCVEAYSAIHELSELGCAPELNKNLARQCLKEIAEQKESDGL